MNTVITGFRRVLGIGFAWAIVWLAFWAIVFVIIGLVDPDSIDPGEDAAAAAVLGSMGLLSGVAFGVVLSMDGRGRTAIDLPMIRVAGSGFVGCAIAQVAYLRHGDLGLAANIRMALLLSTFGGIVTIAWLVIVRRWSHRRSSA